MKMRPRCRNVCRCTTVARAMVFFSCLLNAVLSLFVAKCCSFGSLLENVHIHTYTYIHSSGGEVKIEMGGWLAVRVLTQL